MPKIESVPELSRRLAVVRPRFDAIAGASPERALDSIRRQLDAVTAHANAGVPPSQAQKDELNLGLLASRHVHDLDPDVAEELYAIASWMTYWR